MDLPSDRIDPDLLFDRARLQAAYKQSLEMPLPGPPPAPDAKSAIFLRSQCHTEETGVHLCYRDGLLYATCPACNRVVCVIPVGYHAQ